MKKLLKVIISIALVILITAGQFACSAIVTSYGGTLHSLPGNTRSSAPVYNYGWLDNVIIRDDAMAVTSTTMVPRPVDYKSSHTCDEFVQEVGEYTKLFALDEEAVAQGYDEITKTMYYAITAMGLTDEYSRMRRYIEKHGIRVGGDEGAIEKMQVAIVYSAIKNDTVYTLYGKHVEFPEGIDVEGAMVIILAALSNTILPSGIDTFTGFAFLTTKTYVQEFEELPLSDNPDSAEIFHWAKALSASGQDYNVPVVAYDEATVAQKQYVDYAYYASILATAYEVKVDPIRLVIATQNGEEYGLQKFILRSMLEEKGVEYTSETTLEELFELAVDNGWFALEDEFYSDVLTYEVQVAPSCQKIWFTPFALADQLEGGSEEYLKIMLGDTEVKPASTTAVELDIHKDVEQINLTVYYDDGDRNEYAPYVFTIVKNPALEKGDTDAQSSGENDMIVQLEDYVDRIIPVENEKVSEVVSEVFTGIDEKASSAMNEFKEEITTFGTDEQTTYSLEETEAVDDTVLFDVTEETYDTEETERFDFEYLDELIEGAYATDENGNIITTTAFDMTQYEDETTEQSIVERATEIVKENPEIVVAPSSLVAVGSLAGYLLSKKHRGDRIIEEEENEYSDDDE